MAGFFVPSSERREQALFEGRYFVFTTGEQTLGSSQFLNVVMSNPANSGKRHIITKRRFDNSVVSGNAPLSYGGIALPVLYATGTTGLVTSNGSNLTRDGVNPRPASLLTLQALVSATRLNNAAGNANPTGAGRLATGGMPTKLEESFILMPGTTFGQFIQAPAGLGASVNAGLTFYVIEEPL
ncbi:hypothetical protein [Methylobacterium iners]|uniref:Uncharacterized protein n=1 Tax=Methylobacterium iners TaxID=418707 RepID=A0ABQ4RQ81_9HYPH|nr:hypothetical protein [Methylobacterium iners]GJD92918.1 hypothetical protein OCOJLMKI_0101 [Methylobacterium iners]